MAFERGQFIKSLLKLKRAFRVQFRDVRFMAEVKAQATVDTVFAQIEAMFKEEINGLVQEYG